MKRIFLKSKIHGAFVTETNLDYEGSLTIDRDLMDKTDILPFEQVDVYNLANGTRFTTYAIEGKRGSGTICVNGAAAHLAKVGDRLIVACYALFGKDDWKKRKPKIIRVNEKNRPV